MERLIFNSGSIYKLYQLESHFRHRGGRHFHLANESECLELLRVTSHSPDRVVQRHFRDFWEHLDRDMVDVLRGEGVHADAASANDFEEGASH